MVGVRSVQTRGKSHVELDILVLRSFAESLDPSVKCEAGLRLLDLLVTKLGRALIGVVELREDVVEGCPVDGVVEVRVRDDALRSGGDQHVGASRELLEVVHEVAVQLPLVVTSARS